MTIASLLSKLKNKHFLSLSGNASMAVLGVVTYALLYRILNEGDMGNWIFYQFAFILLDSVRTGFLQTAFIKFYAGAQPTRRADVTGSCCFLAIVITLLLALPNLAVLTNLNRMQDEGLQLVTHWYGLNLVLTLPFNIAFWKLQAEERFDKILLLRLLNQGSFLLMLLGLLYFHQINLASILYLFLISSTLTSLVSIACGWTGLASLKYKTQTCVKEIFHFGKYSVGSYLCSTLLKSSDTFIIKFMLGPAAVAVYNLPQRLMEIIEIPLRSFVATALPEMSAAFNQNKNEKVIYLMKKYTGLLTMFFIPLIIGMLLCADILVVLLGGQRYLNTEAANVFRIFMFFSILFPIERFPGITLDIIHKPQLNLVKVLLSLAVNVVTDVIAVRLFGSVYGVAAASIFTLLCGVAFGFYALNQYLPFHLKDIINLGYTESKTLVSGMLKKRLALKE